MSKLICEVHDQDRFSRELIIEFINKTPGISLIIDTTDLPDVIFLDADLNGSELFFKENSQLVIISVNEKYVHSLFKDQIADYMYKPDLSYERFLECIEKVKKRRST